MLESDQGTLETKVNKTQCLAVGSSEPIGLKLQKKKKIAVKYAIIIIYTGKYR